MYNNRFLILDRAWTAGDNVERILDMPVSVLVDHLGNEGRAALMRGPLVYAADRSYLPDGRLLLDAKEPGKGMRATTDESTGAVHLIAQTGGLKQIANICP